MALKDHKEFWETIGTIVQIVAIAGGGLFGLYEYMQKEQADRVKESLTYVDRYYKAPIFDTRTKLEKVWSDNEDNIISKLKSSENEYENFVLNTIRDKHIEPEIFSLIGFYESASSCVQANICDRDAIRTYFCADIRSFYHLHFRFIAHMRKKRNDNSFGNALEQFVKSNCRHG